VPSTASPAIQQALAPLAGFGITGNASGFISGVNNYGSGQFGWFSLVSRLQSLL